MIQNSQDRLHLNIMKTIAIGVIALLGMMILLLVIQSWDAISKYSLQFITSDFWNPVEDQFGGLSFIYGTVVTSILALFIAAPLSIAVALFISEVLPQWAGKIIGLFVELIAAVPSIVFGLWGIFYLAPWVRVDLSPFLKSFLGFLPIFQGPSFGIGMLSASLILAIMITPTITSICKEVFQTIPSLQKEAALGLGATRFEMVQIAVLKPSFSGIMGGVVLGLGRALGETMAVAMVIGNQASISTSLFAPASTMAAVIANEYAEAESDLHLSALCLIGLLLFIVTLFINALARGIVWYHTKRVNT